MDATKSGLETRQYVRIQVIGRDRVGKTSLVRRLLFPEDGEYDGKSTDGIEINRKCQIRRNDGEWFVGEVDTHQKEMIRRIELAGSMEQSETISKQTRQRLSKEYVLETETIQKEQIPTTSKEYLLDIEKKQHDQEPLLSYEKDIVTVKLDGVTKINLSATTINADDNELRKTDKQTHDIFTNPELIDTHVMPADQKTEMMNQKLDEIMSRAKTCTVKGKKVSDDLVECGIWDFAGQRDYYATHQTFFTPHAIYLLVADIEDNIKPLTHNEDDCYCIDDYIDFWFDNIHCFCNNHSAEKLCPPVIMVCTGTDKFEKAEDKEIYADKLLVYFGKDNKFNHNRGIYFISNTQFKEEDSKEIKILRKHISNIALEMGYFGETLPTKWIQLETAVKVLKDLNIYVYSWYNMEKLAQKYSLEEKELLLFLNYQHKIGNVIFFKEISEYIILQPNWLVKCFRCLVCDSNNGKINFNLICPTAWNALKSSGELSDILISQLFQKEPELKFGDHKTYLLNIMEKFDIVIKPKFRDTSIDKCQKSDSYFLPCMIDTSSSYEDILDTFISKSSDVSITPWLIFEFEFLPFAYFNHILFHYIRNYEVCEVKGLYRGKAVFYLAELSKFIICFSHNAVSVQIWRRHDVLDDNVYQTFLNELCDIIETIQGKLRHTISYSIKFKCSTGDYSESSDRIPLKNNEDISGEYLCNEHSCVHSMADLGNSWLKHFVSIDFVFANS
ncbi:probable serine/threonine-protein kinase pats1 [Mytilus edulis]|uniref:probable serine/threonine-protein kinase pats1 n=1 Tax=Mytilus edulis TaxID=6550 RepID=UPI0039F0BB1A